MNKRRLLKLADLLEADAKNKKGIKFDLSIWAGPADRAGHFEEVKDSVPVSCNTTACAVGLACVSGAFKRSGLGFEMVEASFGEGYRLRPTFRGMIEFRAVQEFFGIGRESAEFLFLIDTYPTSKTKGAAGERFVAKRIRDFVAGKAKAT